MKSVATVTLLLSFISAWARPLGGPYPVNPQERAFFKYLERVASIRFADNVPVDPWFECDDRYQKRTFFSASFYQFTENRDIDINLRAWVASFLDHAYWARVFRATCTFDVNHFNDCKAQGTFYVQFRNQRVIYFQEGESTQSCGRIQLQ